MLAAVLAAGAGGAIWILVIGPNGSPTGGGNIALSGASSGAGTATVPTAVGRAVGDLAPDFKIVDIDGNTITRDSLRGRPAVVWFTASYCAPCQEGAVALRRVLDRLGAADKVAVVMVFVDPGDTKATMASWKAQFGSPNWAVGLTSSAMFTDYAVQYLDTKYLLDSNGAIRVFDFSTLQEGPWERDLRAVLGS